MGNISAFDISGLKNKYGLANYLETGTGFGLSLSYALTFNFERNISIEIFDEVYSLAVDKFKDSNCELYKGISYEVLPTVLKTLSTPTLFFLDAHFPGTHIGLGYGDELDLNKRLPLRKELEVVIENYPLYKQSVFILDDLRIYEDGPFQSGNWSERVLFGAEGINFVYELFLSTHDIEKHYSSEGYIVLSPKQN